MERKSLAFKLNISIAILLFLILAVGVYSISMINKAQDYAQDTGENALPSVLSGANITTSIGNASRRHVRLLGDWINQSSSDVKKENSKSLDDFIQKAEENIKNHKKFVNSPEEQQLLDNLLIHWKEVEENIKQDHVLAESNRSVEAFARFKAKTNPAVFKTLEEANKLSKMNAVSGIESTKRGAYLTNLTNVIMLATVTISVLVSLLILQIIRKSTSSITVAVDNLKTQSVSTSQIATDLKNGSKSLSDSVAEQAASVHETSAAINEITSMVNRTAENAKESTNVAKAASSKAEDGQKTMQRLVQAMETIQESNSQLQNIAGIINQINAKTAVINDIVSKTELLSLNASIESARAGEYGKGFAVVAEEVGNLAKISGKSAHEIQELITSSQEQVNTILGLTKERVDDGKKVTAEAQESFLQISEDISTMSNVIQQISEATREQEIGVRQISTAMSQIDRATQNSQAAVNTTSESSNILVEQSDKLDKTAKDVELLITGSVK